LVKNGLLGGTKFGTFLGYWEAPIHRLNGRGTHRKPFASPGKTACLASAAIFVALDAKIRHSPEVNPLQKRWQSILATDVVVSIHRLSHCHSRPRSGSSGAAGFDLTAAVKDKLTIEPMEIAKIPTGLVLGIPGGFEGQIRSRSGLASQGIIVANGIGTIDSDYRGEIFVLLANLGKVPFAVVRGDRIAQLIISIVPKVVWTEQVPSDSERGEGGFGSTGR
jgi:dUTP pyrophosphatase